MAEPHHPQELGFQAAGLDFELVETVEYDNGGVSYYYVELGEKPLQEKTAVILDEGICKTGQGQRAFSYSKITNKQNEYMDRCSRVYRFVDVSPADVSQSLESFEKAATTAADAPRINAADRANLADASPLEHVFEERFTQVYGADSAKYLWKEYGITDAKGSTRFLDYLVETSDGRIAVEENGVTYHHPQLVGEERYRDQLLKQNSCVAAGIKLFRFSTEDCGFEERLEDDIRSFFGPSASAFKPCGIVVSRPFRLYDHQVDVLAQMEADRATGCSSFLAVLPTASGKSQIAIEDMARVAQVIGSGFRALVLAPNRAVLEDWQARIAHELPQLTHCIEVRSYQYLERHCSEYAPSAFSYILVDEAHHAVAPGLKRTIQHFAPRYLVGLTATDQRPDKRRLEDVFGTYRVSLSLQDAMERGIVARANVFRVETNIDLSQVRINGRDYVNADLERSIRVTSRNELIVQVIKDYLCGGEVDNRQGVIFCVNVRHTLEIECLLNAAGISAKAYSGRTANPAQVMADFKAGKVRFLCACQMISEGWDYPELGILVMARPTLSKVLYLQQLGRGLRKTSTKSNVFVVDVVDDYGAAANVVPCSMHSIFANPRYVPFGDILRRDYTPGELIEVDGLVERVERITEVDIFSFEDKYGDYLSQEQLAREYFVSTGTITSWMRKGRLTPTASFVFGSRKLHMFSPEDAERYRGELGIEVHDDNTILADFKAFLEERDYSLSYKMPFMLGLLEHMDPDGDARIDDVLDSYIAFYRSRLERRLPVDRKTCPYTLETLEDRKAIRRSMLTNPFEKFERKRFMYYSKDLGVISLNHALHARLGADDIERIRSQMHDDLANCFEGLGGL